MRALVIVSAVALGACAGVPKPDPKPAKLIGSDFCEIQKKKLTWVPADTRGTIDGIVKFNERWDSRCLKRRKKTS